MTFSFSFSQPAEGKPGQPEGTSAVSNRLSWPSLGGGPRGEDVTGNGLGGSNSARSGEGGDSWWHDLNEADTLGDGARVLFRVVPYWVPAVGLLSAVGAYYVVFRVRLFLAKWSIAERRKAERRYELLDNLRGAVIDTGASVQSLGDDDGDEEDEEDDDETAVSMRDVEEFRSSLGIRLPRDEDLLSIVEKMLLVDPIPDGWVLYRTTAGIIRFLNLNTQELAFFPPNKRKEKATIEGELARRNRQAVESKYNFVYDDDAGDAKSPNAARGASGSGTSRSTGPSNNLYFGSNDGDDDDDSTADETQTSTFNRMFNYFLEREQRKIQTEVARSRGGAAGTQNGSGSASVTHGAMPVTPRGGANGGAQTDTSASRTLRQAQDRVVASSTIRGSR